MRHQLIALVLGEVPHEVRGELFPARAGKSKPVYSQAAAPAQVRVGEERVLIDGRPVVFQLRGYPPDVLLLEASLDVETLFDQKVLALTEMLYREAYRLLEARGGEPLFSEEYSVFAVSGYEGPPEQFLDHAAVMASLLKSEGLDLDPKEIEHTLQAHIKYGMNDMAVVDWNGAFLFDDLGDFDEDIELLVLANLQLLRHRILDRQLDERLTRLGELAQKTADGRPFRRSELASGLRETIRIRTSSISALQQLDRQIRLIGDWYSARLFDLAARKFRIEAWRNVLRGKLESVEDIHSMIAENFSVSAKHRAEWYQILAFFVLQIGWFLLIILEFWYFTHH